MHVERFDRRVQAVAAAAELIARNTDATNLFVSGGSSFAVFEALDNQLNDQTAEKFTIYQVDERYGELGHESSNWNLFENTKLGRYKASFPILQPDLDMTATAMAYDGVVDEALKSGARNVAILGVGDDHHVSGVKPMEKITFDSLFGDDWVVDYEWEDFSRITTTLGALNKFDQLVIFAAGENKQGAVDSLEQDMPEHESPIHGLINHPDITVIYTKE